MSRYTEIAERLRGVGSDLDDLALDLLHEAMADGATRRPDADKVLTQAPARRRESCRAPRTPRLRRNRHHGRPSPTLNPI